MAHLKLKSKRNIQSDEKLITEFVQWLRKSFPRLTFKAHLSLSEILPEPDSPTLLRFRNHQWAHADISVFRHGKLVCIIEPGGYQHITDPKQTKRDAKKYLICKQAGVSMLSLMNEALKDRETPQFRRLLKAYFYSTHINQNT